MVSKSIEPARAYNPRIPLGGIWLKASTIPAEAQPVGGGMVCMNRSYDRKRGRTAGQRPPSLVNLAPGLLVLLALLVVLVDPGRMGKASRRSAAADHQTAHSASRCRQGKQIRQNSRIRQQTCPRENTRFCPFTAFSTRRSEGGEEAGKPCPVYVYGLSAGGLLLVQTEAGRAACDQKAEKNATPCPPVMHPAYGGRKQKGHREQGCPAGNLGGGRFSLLEGGCIVKSIRSSS